MKLSRFADICCLVLALKRWMRHGEERRWLCSSRSWILALVFLLLLRLAEQLTPSLGGKGALSHPEPSRIRQLTPSIVPAKSPLPGSWPVGFTYFL